MAKLKPTHKLNHMEVNLEPWTLDTTEDMDKKLEKPFKKALAQVAQKITKIIHDEINDLDVYSNTYAPLKVLIHKAATEALQIALKESSGDAALMFEGEGLELRVWLGLGPSEGMGPSWDVDLNEVIETAGQDWDLKDLKKLHTAMEKLTKHIGWCIQNCNEVEE